MRTAPSQSATLLGEARLAFLAREFEVISEERRGREAVGLWWAARVVEGPLLRTRGEDL